MINVMAEAGHKQGKYLDIPATQQPKTHEPPP